MVARGSGLAFLVMAGLIALVAVGMPAWLYLSGTPIGQVCGTLDPQNVVKIWMITLGVDALLILMAGYFRSRRLVLDGNTLSYSTWFGRNAWPLSTITAVTRHISSVPGDTNPDRYLVLWSGTDRRVRINLHSWRQAELEAFLEMWRRKNPSLQIAPELAGLFGVGR